MRFVWSLVMAILWTLSLVLSIGGVAIALVPGANYLLEWGFTIPSRFQIDEARITSVLTSLAAGSACLLIAILVGLVAAVLSLSEPRRPRPLPPTTSGR